MFNVDRTSSQPPSSLAFKRRYDSEDVLLELRNIFFDKCYICECKEPTALNVEHLRPHSGDEAKKFDWNNLYYSCARCNSIKGEGYSGIIDCTDSSIDALRSIKHLPPRTPGSKIDIEATNQLPATLETAELLDKVYNAVNTANKAITASYLRKKVFKRYNLFLRYLDVYMDELTADEKKSEAREVIGKILKKQGEFSAFIRWLILDDENLKKDFEDFID